MKTSIPTSASLRAELLAIEQRKQQLIQGFLMAHDVTSGNWQILPDGSAFVPAEEKEAAKEELKP